MILEQLNMLESTTDRDSYTYQITHYLLEHRHSIIEYKMNDILERLDISKSTLRRYSIDLGYKNFTDCKSQYKNVGLGQYKNVGFPTLLYCLF